MHHRYEWLYVYGFVRPETGRTFWLILPKVNKELFSRALSEFAEWIGAGKEKRVVVLGVDRAGWHTSEDVELPEGLHLLKLPPRSPELQPAERLWPLVDEPVVNPATSRISARWRGCWWVDAGNSCETPSRSVRTPASTGGKKRHHRRSDPGDFVSGPR